MTTIHRVKIHQVLPDLSLRQITSFRMAGTQAEVEKFGERVRTQWMRSNPGYATRMLTDWPSPRELGDDHVMPPFPDVVW